MRLKTAVVMAASLFVAATSAAPADELVVGVVTDQDGVPVAAARVLVRGADGSPLGSGASAADGSFAVAVPQPGAAVEVGCTYCQTRTAALVAGEPAVVVVRRFRALRDRGAPGPEDLTALPPQPLAAATALVPFAVAARGVSDRGLALGRDVTAADGVPLYRRIDGRSLGLVVPAVAVRRVDPVDGAFEAGFATADGPGLRAATGPAGGVVGQAGRGGRASLLAAAGNGGYDLAAGAARLPLAGGRLTATALAASWADLRLAGGTLAYATASRRYDTAASLALARSFAAGVPDAELLFDAHLRARSPAAPTLGLRARTSSGGEPAPGTQTERALYAAAQAPLRGGTLAASVVAEREAYPSLAYDAAGTTGLSVHAAVRTYAVAPAPGDPVAFARARLAELSVERSDLRRLDVLATAYAERTRGTARSDLTGAAVRLGWQVAPRLALRAWLLGANRSIATPVAGTAGYVAESPGASYSYGPADALSGRIGRRLAWLTYDNALRADLVYRGGPLDASISLPFAGARLSLGTTLFEGRRTLSLALTR